MYFYSHYLFWLHLTFYFNLARIDCYENHKHRKKIYYSKWLAICVFKGIQIKTLYVYWLMQSKNVCLTYMCLKRIHFFNNFRSSSGTFALHTATVKANAFILHQSTALYLCTVSSKPTIYQQKISSVSFKTSTEEKSKEKKIFALFP